MTLFTFPTGLFGGTKSESLFFGLNEIEGNRSPARLAGVELSESVDFGVELSEKCFH